MKVLNIASSPWAKLTIPVEPVDQHDGERPARRRASPSPSPSTITWTKRSIDDLSTPRYAAADRLVRLDLLGRARQHDPAGLQHVARRRRARGRGWRSARRAAASCPPRGRSARGSRNSSRVSIGARPSDGSSSSSSRGRSISARAIASICCSPPLSAAGVLRAPLRAGAGSSSKQRSMSLRRPRRLSRRAVGADAQVLLDGQLGERAAALGHVRDALPGDLSRGCSPTGPCRRSGRRPERRTMPEIARSVVVLPAPLGPRTATIRPSSTLKVDRRAARVTAP